MSEKVRLIKIPAAREKDISDRIAYLDYLKAFAIIMVVILHSISYARNSFALSGRAADVINLICYYTSRPLFFLLSGYFCRKQDIKQFYLKRFKTLIIPYWFFAAGKLFYTNVIDNEFAHASGFLQQVYDGYVLGNLYWFPYALFVIQLLFPLIAAEETAAGFKEKPVRAFCCFIALLLTNVMMSLMNIGYDSSIVPFQLMNALQFGPYFILGYLLKYDRNRTRSFLDSSKGLLLPLTALVVFVTLALKSSPALKWSYSAAFVFFLASSYLFYVLARQLPSSAVLKTIGKYTWQIHFLDPFLKTVLIGLTSRVMGINLGIVLIVSMINVLIALWISMIVAKIPVLKVLFGL